MSGARRKHRQQLYGWRGGGVMWSNGLPDKATLARELAGSNSDEYIVATECLFSHGGEGGLIILATTVLLVLVTGLTVKRMLFTYLSWTGDSDNRSCENLECYMVLIQAEKTAIGSICFLAGIITLLENALVVVVIVATASLRQRPSFLFIGSLALADVFASCFFTTSFLDFHLFRRSDGPTAYLFKLGGVTLAFSSSVGSLLLTALDRYLCIHQASSYKVLVTRRRALLSLLILWSATILMSFLPLMGWRCPTGLSPPCSRLFPYINQGYLAFWTTFILVILALILGAYALILWTAHRHEASMTNIQGASGTGHARMRMDIRLARTFGLILLILVGCWLPALSFMLADVSVLLTHTQQRAFAFCSTLCLVNSAVNPLLYALRCRELKIALLQLLQKLCEIGKCPKSTGNLTPQLTALEDNNCTTCTEEEMHMNRCPQLNSISEMVTSPSDIRI